MDRQDKFFDSILSSAGYSTPGNRRSLFPSLRFYSGMVRTIIKAHSIVKKNNYNGKNWSISSFNMLDDLEAAGLKLSVDGLNNIRSFNGPAVFIGNHMSSLETVVLPCLIQPNKPVVFVMKQELLNYPFFGPVTGARHPVVVGRSNPREDLNIVFTEGEARLRDGRSVIIFPQRTRSSRFIPAEFNTLGVKLAKRADVPIIPVAIISDAWGNGKLIKDFGKIDPNKKVVIHFGKPVNVNGNGTEAHQYVLEFIESVLIREKRNELIIK